MHVADDILSKDIFEFLTRYVRIWLSDLGVGSVWANGIADFSGFIIVVVLAMIAFYITRIILVSWLHRMARKSTSNWDDAFVDRKVFKRLAYLVPAIIIHGLSVYVIPDYPNTLKVIRILIRVYIDTVGLVVMLSVLNAAADIYNSFDISKARPIKGFMQVIKIVLIIIYIIILVTIVFVKDKSFQWIAGLGAFSAILMLVFKDPILGFVGGIQMMTNDMLRIGDWIEVPKFGADGNVIDITITTVKIQNFDKTITTIPPYSLITDSFKNWRGMEESEGRRIKRSIILDMSSVKFCTPEMLQRFMKFEHVADYVRETEEAILKYNKERQFDNSELLNGRRQTNLGVFRAYVTGYLRNNPNIHQEMTFLVRQLAPTETGIPIEIYVFSREKEWAVYEVIQADIFDHIIAAVNHFDLRLFQNPTGYDMQKMGTTE